MAFPVIPITFKDTIFEVDFVADSLFKLLMVDRLDNRDTRTISSSYSGSEENVPDGYHEIKVLTEYAKRAGAPNFKFYQSEDKKFGHIVGRNTSKYDRVLVSTVPVLLSGWFEKKPLTDLERKCLECICKADAANLRMLEQLMNELYETKGIGSEVIWNACSAFMNRMVNAKSNAVEEKVHLYQAEIQRNVDEYRTLCDNLREAQALLMGLKMNAENVDAKELMDMFTRNKSLRLIPSDNNRRLEFEVLTRFTQFQPELWKGALVHQVFSGTEPDGMIELLNRTFCDDPEWVINGIAYFSIDDRVRSDTYHTFVNGADRLPNPHLQHYNCFGNSQHSMQELLNAGEVCGCVYQCLSYAGTLNLVDYSVMRKFLHDLTNSGKSKCFHNIKENKDYTFDEARQKVLESGGENR